MARALTKVGALRGRGAGTEGAPPGDIHRSCAQLVDEYALAVEKRALPVDLKKLSFASCTGVRDEFTASSRNDITEI